MTPLFNIMFNKGPQWSEYTDFLQNETRSEERKLISTLRLKPNHKACKIKE